MTWRRPVGRGSILYESNCMTSWKRCSSGDRENICGGQELGGRGGWRGRAQSIVRAGTLFCTILRCWIIIVLSQLLDCPTPGVNADVTFGLWWWRCASVGSSIAFFFCLFRAAPTAYGGSQARNLWCHSHSNTGSQPCLLQLTAMPDP